MMRSLVTVVGPIFCAGALLLIPATAYAQGCFPAPDDIVSWWPGDGDASDIIDGNSGILQNGVAFASGQVGQGFLLDGVNDFVEVPHNPNLDPLSSFSIEAWVNTSLTGHSQTIVSKYECGLTCIPFVSNSLLFLQVDTAGFPAFVIRDTDSSVAQTITGSTFVADGNWHYLVATRDLALATVNLFSDGSLDTTAALISGSDGVLKDDDLEADPFIIGGRFVGDNTSNMTEFVSGEIDEVSVYARALTAVEIAALFASGTEGKCKDEDEDGFRPPEDCDETNAAINPDAVELPGNFVDENCDGSLGDVDPCFDWKSHGEYIRSVAHAVNDLVVAGILSEEEGDALISSAAMSKIGKKGFIPVECQ